MEETTIIDIVDALHTGDGDAVTAASLGRVWQHVKDLDKQSFAILTSWRSGLSPSQNKSRFKQLEQAVRGLKLGYFKLVGHWRECQDEDVEYDECPPMQLVDTTEPSLFVPGIDMRAAHKLGKKYEQDAIIFGGPESDGKVVLVFKSGKTMPIGKFSPRTIGQGFSELANQQGRGFAFLAFATDSPTEAMSASVYEQATYGRKLYNSATGGKLV